MPKILFVETKPNRYSSVEGHTLQQEWGYAPYGQLFSGEWVLRDPNQQHMSHAQDIEDVLCGYHRIVSLKELLTETFK